MWKNYLKTSFRNLLRHKGYTLINILGLTFLSVGYHTLKAAWTNPVDSLQNEG